MTLQAGDTTISESDGRTPVTLIRDLTSHVTPELPPHQRYWAVSRPSGARQQAIVHKGERVIQVNDRTKVEHPLRIMIDEAVAG